MIINLKPYKQLTVTELYDKVSQEDIYSYYLGQSIKPDKLYNCCFHKDDSPSLGFYKTKYGNIRFNCFGCKAEGSVIEFVMKKENLVFPEALNRIQVDLGLLKPLESIIKSNRISNISFKESVSDRLKIAPIKKPFTKFDGNLWSERKIDLIDLYNANIYPCSSVFYTNKEGETKLYGYYTEENPLYCIEIDKGIYKIYRPLSKDKKGKWFTNASSHDLQGMQLLSPRRKLLIITSSMKDVIILRKLGYEAIAPMSEGTRIPDKLLDYLISTSEQIIYFNDTDNAGYNYTFKLSKETGFGYIFIPKYYLVKDISDFSTIYGLKEAGNLMDRLLKRVNKCRTE